MNLERSKKQPNKRGKPKIPVEVLKNELKIKEESVKRKEASLKYLKRHVREEMITESDLEEYNDLLSTDEEEGEYSTKT